MSDLDKSWNEIRDDYLNEYTSAVSYLKEIYDTKDRTAINRLAYSFIVDDMNQFVFVSEITKPDKNDAVAMRRFLIKLHERFDSGQLCFCDSYTLRTFPVIIFSDIKFISREYRLSPDNFYTSIDKFFEDIDKWKKE